MQWAEIGKSLSIPEVTVSKWRRRFLRHGIAGLEDAPRSGKPAKYDGVTVKRVFALLDRNPPAGYGRWNGRLIARHLADVSPDQVWRILRQQGIELERRRSWCISTLASRLNQIEIWFSILSRQSLRGANFTSVAQLRHAIDEFIKNYNSERGSLRMD